MCLPPRRSSASEPSPVLNLLPFNNTTNGYTDLLPFVKAAKTCLVQLESMPVAAQSECNGDCRKMMQD
jgi:hypothetical protein